MREGCSLTWSGLHLRRLEGSEAASHTANISYVICRSQRNVKMWGICSQIIKNFKTATAEH